MNDTPQVGLTRTQGWEMGVRRTFPIEPERAWAVLMTSPGIEMWLGEGVNADTFDKGITYQTGDGTRGELRSYTEGSLIRMTWQPKDWDAPSTLQIRVIAAATGATVSIHHEKMQSGDQREQMLKHWNTVLDRLAPLLAKPQ